MLYRISAPTYQNKVIQNVQNWKYIKIYLNFFKILYNNQSEFPHSKIQPLDAKTQIRIQQMIQYIQKHFSEMITLEDLAASANISRSEAGRCFQSIMLIRRCLI